MKLREQLALPAGATTDLPIINHRWTTLRDDVSHHCEDTSNAVDRCVKESRDLLDSETGLAVFSHICCVCS